MPRYLWLAAVLGLLGSGPPSWAQEITATRPAGLILHDITPGSVTELGPTCPNGNGLGEPDGKGKEEKKGNKTIFEWRIGREQPEREEEDDVIVTDRPDFTEASSTVGKGRLQIESGYTFFYNKGPAPSEGLLGAEPGHAVGPNTKEYLHSYPEMLFRVGLFADWFELRLQPNYLQERTVNGRITTAVAGGQDLYTGVKLYLTEQKGVLPEASLVLQTYVPTGNVQFSANRLLPGFNYLYGWDILDWLNAGASTQLNVRVDDDGHSYTQFAQSFTIGYSLTKKLGAYTEWFMFAPSGATAAETVVEHYADGGFTYKVTKDLQLDIRAGVGLTRHATDFFTGTGFSVRF